MQSLIAFFQASWPDQQRAFWRWGWPALVVGLALVASLIVRRLALRPVYRRAALGVGYWPVLAQALRIPSLLWCLCFALTVGLRYVDLSEAAERAIGKGIVAFLIISLMLVSASVGVRVMTEYGERRSLPFAVAGLSRTLIYVLTTLIGAVMLLALLDINVTPLLTALGVGGLAVALALQDTLANFFAGVHILIEAPLRVGDVIKLSSGEEGMVTDIGWRTTRVSTGAHNTIVIPNTKITSGILVNYSLPTKREMIEIPVYAGLEADPQQVLRLCLEAANSVPTVLADPPPEAQFDPGVTLTHLQCKLLLHVEQRLLKGPAQSAVRLALVERFRAEGVPMPSPAAWLAERAVAQPNRAP